MAMEEANTIYIPFIGEFEVDSIKGAALLVGGLTVGQALKHMTDGFGQNLSNSATNAVATVVPSNPVTGDGNGADVL